MIPERMENLLTQIGSPARDAKRETWLVSRSKGRFRFASSVLRFAAVQPGALLMTVGQVIESILDTIPHEIPNTVDTLKSGDPSAEVSGIATTFSRHPRRTEAGTRTWCQPYYHARADLLQPS
jgi:hypothetical protein